MAWLATQRVTARRLSKLGIVSLALVFAAACVKRLPPAPTPEHIVPDADVATPLPEGHGRLVVDVVEGAVPVQRGQMKPEPIEGEDGRVTYQFNETFESLCDTTPCVLDLQPGNIILGFPVVGDESALQIDLVHVGADETSVYRRSLAISDTRKGGGYKLGIWGTVLGSVAMITGTALLPVGLAEDKSEMALAGGITLGVGAALLTLGIWLLNENPSTYRPGSWTHYPLSVGTTQP